jgi:hypothetical protein
VLLRVVYWVMVVAVSLALVVALVLFLESRDQSELDRGGGAQVALSRAP